MDDTRTTINLDIYYILVGNEMILPYSFPTRFYAHPIQKPMAREIENPNLNRLIIELKRIKSNRYLESSSENFSIVYKVY